MNYRLILTERAKQDRDDAFRWFGENFSQEFAARWYSGIAVAIESLHKNPERCHKARERDYFPFILYELLFGRRRNKFRILFKLSEDSVIILHIRHSSKRDLTEKDL